MKQAIAGGMVVICAAWGLYVFTTTSSCERVYRGAAPVRVVGDVARWAAKNWLSTDGRLSMIRWSIEADQAVQRFLTHQFYGASVQCVAPSSGAAAPAGSIPAPAESPASGSAGAKQ